MKEETIVLIFVVFIFTCIAILYMKMVNIYYDVQKQKHSTLASDFEYIFYIYKNVNPNADRNITLREMILYLNKNKITIHLNRSNEKEGYYPCGCKYYNLDLNGVFNQQIKTELCEEHKKTT